MTLEKAIRIVFIIIFLAILAWIISQNLILSGKFIAQHNFCKGSRFISYLYPENRISPVIYSDNFCYQNIFVEPAYFDVKLPRTFYQARVDLEYKNPNNNKMSLAVMKKREHPLDWNFKIKPINNKRINDLDWYYINKNGISLWQKEKKFSSIKEFVNNLPKKKKIVLFNYEFDKRIIREHKNIIEWSDNINFQDKHYIIAEFIPPKNLKKGWKKASVYFNLNKSYINERAFEFMISIPGLTEKRQKVSIKNIKVTLLRPKTNFNVFLKDLKSFFMRKIKATLL